MQNQLEFNFLHEQENNKESQKHRNKNAKSFNQNCLIVFERLMKGEQLTVLQCANDGIASLPRRIKDLKDKCVEVSDKWDGNIKVYFMSKQQIKNNEKFKIYVSPGSI